MFMDNLYNLIALTCASHQEKAMIDGMAQLNGKGIPLEVIQKEEKLKEVQETVRGTVNMEVLKKYTLCPDVVATCFRRRWSLLGGW